MRNYTTKDFSEIHSMSEKPAMPGWYCYWMSLNDAIYARNLQGAYQRLYKIDFIYWTGEYWCYDSDGTHKMVLCDFITMQDCYYFGLTERAYHANQNR